MKTTNQVQYIYKYVYVFCNENNKPGTVHIYKYVYTVLCPVLTMVLSKKICFIFFFINDSTYINIVQAIYSELCGMWFTVIFCLRDIYLVFLINLSISTYHTYQTHNLGESKFLPAYLVQEAQAGMVRPIIPYTVSHACEVCLNFVPEPHSSWLKCSGTELSEILAQSPTWSTSRLKSFFWMGMRGPASRPNTIPPRPCSPNRWWGPRPTQIQQHCSHSDFHSH